MDMKTIFEGKATIEDILILNGLGFEFVIEGGKITGIEERG